MPYYRCLVNGTGFPGAMIGRDGTAGFYTTRWLQALNAGQAKRRVLAGLRREPGFQPPPRPRKRWYQRKAPPGPDMSHAAVQFVRIERVDRLPRLRREGTLWYPEKG